MTAKIGFITDNPQVYRSINFQGRPVANTGSTNLLSGLNNDVFQKTSGVSDCISSTPEAERLDDEFAKSLPNNPNAGKTTLKVGQGASSINGYYAVNPETGTTVYADQNGRRFHEKAFKNWEQFAKDGTLPFS